MTMSPEIVLFILRILGSIVLLGFVAVMFVTIRRDMALAETQASAQRKSHGQLVVISSQDVPLQVGVTFPLLPITTIGRAPANSVHLPDSYASTHHALVSLRSGQWWLEDRDSRNQTLLNGQPVNVSTVISAGDIIGVGRIQLKLVLD